MTTSDALRRRFLATVAVSILAALLLVWMIAIYRLRPRQHQLDEALLGAIWQGDTAAAAIALDKGADPNMRFDPSRIRSSDFRVRLLDSIQRFDGVFRSYTRRSISDPPEPTALMSAAMSDRADMVRLLLEKGAVVDARDDSGFSALLYAARDGHSGTVRELLNHGANIQTRAKDGTTALRLAQTKKRDHVVRLLRRAGAKP